MKVAIILAAGIGSRLRPETYEKPKCMVRVKDKPILEYQLKALEKTSIEKVVIVTGYLSQEIEKFISKRNSNKDIILIENKEYLNTNNMYSLKLALDEILKEEIESIFVLNGDVVIEERIAIEMDNSKGSSIAVDTSQYIEESMKVVIDNEGIIKKISKNISPLEYSAVSIDFYKFDGEDIYKLYETINGYISNGERNLWTEVAIQSAINTKELKMKAVDITGLIWWEIDNKIDKERAEYRLRLLEEAQKLIKAKIFSFDLDGTIILGRNEIKGASKLIETLISEGKKVYFITNNSSMSNEEHYKRLISILKTQINPEMIYSSLDYIGDILSRETKAKIYALLPEGSKMYLKKEYNLSFTDSFPDIVLIGFDTSLTYEKLKKACIYVQEGARYILIHPDIRCPTDKGFIPDAGSIGSVVELVTGKKPELVGGKPNPSILKKIAELSEVPIELTCYVGDRLETDMEMAIGSNAIPILFLTGDTSFEDIYSNKELKEKILLGENPEFFRRFIERHKI